MLALLRAELVKMRKSGILFVILAVLFVVFPSASIRLPFVEQAGYSAWLGPAVMAALGYGLMFLPIATALLAGIACRHEHQAGGWRQLALLPVPRGRVYAAKFIVLALAALAMQGAYLAALYAAGKASGITDPFPWILVWKSALGGWAASLPLIALQLWLAVMWRSFAAPFAVNVIFTLPTILAVNSSRVGPYCPWAQSFNLMYPVVEPGDVFVVPPGQALAVVLQCMGEKESRDRLRRPSFQRTRCTCTVSSACPMISKGTTAVFSMPFA